jgi:hypothetical protein
MANRVVATLASVYGWAEKEGLLTDGYLSPTRPSNLTRSSYTSTSCRSISSRALGKPFARPRAWGFDGNLDPGEDSEARPKSREPADDHRQVCGSRAAAAIFTGAQLREILRLEWASVHLEEEASGQQTGPKTITLSPPARAVLVALSRSARYVIRGEG